MSEESQDKTENYRLRNHFEQRYYSMDNERQSFLPLWQDISDHVRPNAVRINTTIKYDKGRRADRCIIDPNPSQWTDGRPNQPGPSVVQGQHPPH
jgi:hypothetical protein